MHRAAQALRDGSIHPGGVTPGPHLGDGIQADHRKRTHPRPAPPRRAVDGRLDAAPVRDSRGRADAAGGGGGRGWAGRRRPLLWRDAGGSARVALLSPDQVRERLKPSLQRWLHELFAARPDSVATLQATQEHVGQVHARIGVPIDLVSRGTRRLKADLHAAIRNRAGDDRLALEAILCADGLIDIAMESMSRAYARSR